MHIQENVPLSQHSTMRLGGPARYLADITNKNEIADAVTWAEQRQLPLMMIGDGSNIVWGDQGFPGLVLVNKIMGFETFNEDGENLYLNIGGGENWDSVVARSVDLGFSGLEQLSLIPGTAGATPVQNVGAYGREISEVLVSVEAYDRQLKRLVNISNQDCGFGYRTSRFKTTDKQRFLITGISLHLVKQNPLPPFYVALQAYLNQHGIGSYTPKVIRDAVIAIRNSKLPDPAQVPNNGSFFANPIVDAAKLQTLLQRHPALVYWPAENGSAKLSAAWLVEQAGFKGVHDTETGMATWPNQALVFVNEQAHSTSDLLKFRQKVIDKVQSLFDITLQQEPELIGT